MGAGSALCVRPQSRIVTAAANATATHGQVMGWFAQAGLQPTVRLEMPFEEVAAGLVGAGYGAALLPARPDWMRVSDTLQVRPLRPALQRSVVDRLAGPASRQNHLPPAADGLKAVPGNLCFQIPQRNQ